MDFCTHTVRTGTLINMEINEIIRNACEDLIGLIGIHRKRKVLGTKSDHSSEQRRRSAVPTMCAPLPKGRSSVFEPSFAGACDTITEHANFVAITNSSDKPTVTKSRKMGATKSMNQCLRPEPSSRMISARKNRRTSHLLFCYLRTARAISIPILKLMGNENPNTIGNLV